MTLPGRSWSLHVLYLLLAPVIVNQNNSSSSSRRDHTGENAIVLGSSLLPPSSPRISTAFRPSARSLQKAAVHTQEMCRRLCMNSDRGLLGKIAAPAQGRDTNGQHQGPNWSGSGRVEQTPPAKKNVSGGI
ncbi:hypothetical protein EJB05_02566, partial [Eragrostis curvula]